MGSVPSRVKVNRAWEPLSTNCLFQPLWVEQIVGVDEIHWSLALLPGPPRGPCPCLWRKR